MRPLLDLSLYAHGTMLINQASFHHGKKEIFWFKTPMQHKTDMLITPSIIILVQAHIPSTPIVPSSRPKVLKRHRLTPPRRRCGVHPVSRKASRNKKLSLGDPFEDSHVA